MNQIDLTLQHLLQYADEGEDMLNRIVTGVESWYSTTNPIQSVLQCNGNIPVHFKPKV
jgi:hypothetical protein